MEAICSSEALVLTYTTRKTTIYMRVGHDGRPRSGETEQADLAVPLGRCSVRISTGTKTLRCFLLSLQANSEISLRVGHDHFLPNPFQFIIHQSCQHLTLYSASLNNGSGEGKEEDGKTLHRCSSVPHNCQFNL
jgi:hypothetical protein